MFSTSIEIQRNLRRESRSEGPKAPRGLRRSEHESGLESLHVENDAADVRQRRRAPRRRDSEASAPIGHWEDRPRAERRLERDGEEEVRFEIPRESPRRIHRGHHGDVRAGTTREIVAAALIVERRCLGRDLGTSATMLAVRRDFDGDGSLRSEAEHESARRDRAQCEGDQEAHPSRELSK